MAESGKQTVDIYKDDGTGPARDPCDNFAMGPRATLTATQMDSLSQIEADWYNQRTRLCAECGAQFWSNRAVVCSEACRFQRRKRLDAKRKWKT